MLGVVVVVVVVVVVCVCVCTLEVGGPVTQENQIITIMQLNSQLG